MSENLEAQLARYAELIRACPHNLLSPRGLAELESRHLPESLSFARMLPSGVDLVDVGPGGGLPGMVIALARPDVRVTMVEATRKKADFLVEATEALGARAVVVHGRIEELARRDLAGRFDVATARAVSALHNLVTWIVPALRPGGELWAIKGERWPQELEEAAGAIAAVGAEVRSTPAASTTSADGTTALPAVVIIGRAHEPPER